MNSVGLTDIGGRRARNEDAMDWDDAGGIAMVADGMGGHPAGDVASRLGLDTAMAALRDDAALPLEQAIRAAHHALLRHGREHPDSAGLGTTMVVVRVEADGAEIAHVGDSRAYRLRDGHLEALTADHNAARQAVAEGAMTPEEARHSIERHMLDRAVGLDGRADAETTRVDVHAGDRLLLCTDGLTGEIGDDTIEAVLNAHRDSPRAACRALVDAALAAGGSDNVTTVLVTIP